MHAVENYSCGAFAVQFKLHTCRTTLRKQLLPMFRSPGTVSSSTAGATTFAREDDTCLLGHGNEMMPDGQDAYLSAKIAPIVPAPMRVRAAVSPRWPLNLKSRFHSKECVKSRCLSPDTKQIDLNSSSPLERPIPNSS